MSRALGRWRILARLGLLAGALVYATWGWSAIEPGEVGIVRRFGRFAAVLEPGLHLRFPPPIESVVRLEPARVRSVEVGFRSEAPDVRGLVGWESPHRRGAAARAEDESLLMTGDGQLVEVAATAGYHLGPRPESLRAVAFGVLDPEVALRALAESAIREAVGRRTLDDLLTQGRAGAEDASRSALQDRVDASGLDLVVSGVRFQDVHPPLAVVDAFRDVSRAASDRQRRVIEGETYREGRLTSAAGLATSMVEQAEARRWTRTERASGEADAFRARLDARTSAPVLTDLRLYAEAITSSFGSRDKVILDPVPGQRHQFFLPDFPADPRLRMSPPANSPE